MFSSVVNRKTSSLGSLLPVFFFLQPQLTKASIYECDTKSLLPYYPFCVNVPSNIPADAKLPVILYLSGKGARGPPYMASSLSGYDGIARLLAQYRRGIEEPLQTMAAEEFITIIPISAMNGTAPNGTYSDDLLEYFPDGINNVIELVKTGYPVDEDRINCVGYSMGSHGCWALHAAYPQLLASSINVGAGAQSSWSPANETSVYSILEEFVDLPIWMIAGREDYDAGIQDAQETQDRLVEVGSTVSQLTILDVDHSGLQSAPFTLDLLNWITEQHKVSVVQGEDNEEQGIQKLQNLTIT